MQISTKVALEKLKQADQLFLELFNHGSMNVEIYKPIKKDLQQPHEKDEIYVVISGTGEFINGNNKTSFQPGDFLFVSAGVEHRFVNFSDDFATWVIFYGAKGGEATNTL